ncbi:MAG TPA: hypothetical protein DCG57_01550 [Candidatus Riflebacteria bacterium]|jgi:hypothetical protein|nr:hypothetical protein [Candidatus Riflebacteria bacterium]
MNKRNGYILLGMLLFFTFIGLSSSITVLEQDTRLKRFSEEDLRQNLGAIRRGIDLYRYKYGTGATPLETALSTGNVEQVVAELTSKNFVRSGVATGTVPWQKTPRHWRIINNYIKNPSFEIDDGSLPMIEVGTWRGNFTAGDGVPDCWTLSSTGAEQHVVLNDIATYVISFWARAVTATSRARVRVWKIDPADGLACDLTADEKGWKRYFGSFHVGTVPAAIRLELVQAGTTSNDTVYIDGMMLEKWLPPPGTPAVVPPSPSAWTHDYTITPLATESAQQQRLFKEMIPQGASPASFSWWFQW